MLVDVCVCAILETHDKDGPIERFIYLGTGGVWKPKRRGRETKNPLVQMTPH